MSPRFDLTWRSEGACDRGTRCNDSDCGRVVCAAAARNASAYRCRKEAPACGSKPPLELIAQVHQRIDEGVLADADKLNMQLASLASEREALAKMPTWPWETETLAGFVLGAGPARHRVAAQVCGGAIQVVRSGLLSAD